MTKKNESERVSIVVTDVFRTVGLKNVGDFRVFHPKCVIITIDRDCLSKETRGGHVNIEDPRIEIIGLDRE